MEPKKQKEAEPVTKMHRAWQLLRPIPNMLFSSTITPPNGNGTKEATDDDKTELYKTRKQLLDVQHELVHVQQTMAEAVSTLKKENEMLRSDLEHQVQQKLEQTFIDQPNRLHDLTSRFPSKDDLIARYTMLMQETRLAVLDTCKTLYPNESLSAVYDHLSALIDQAAQTVRKCVIHDLRRVCYQALYPDDDQTPLPPGVMETLLAPFLHRYRQIEMPERLKKMIDDDVLLKVQQRYDPTYATRWPHWSNHEGNQKFYADLIVLLFQITISPYGLLLYNSSLPTNLQLYHRAVCTNRVPPIYRAARGHSGQQHMIVQFPPLLAGTDCVVRGDVIPIVSIDD